MKISDSNVQMASANRSYRQGSASGSSFLKSGGGSALVSGLQNQRSYSWTDMLNLSAQKNGAEPSANYGSGFGTSGVGKSFGTSTIGLQNQMSQLRGSMVNLLMSRLMGASGIGGAYNMGGGSFAAMNYYEEESASFSAQGKVLTEDGRSLDFNIDVEMSRAFMEYTQVQMPSLGTVFTDPLVINTGSGIASISDQKFKFDLDVDGEEEWISMPTRGSGFLALDKNGDGVINDGSELFGTESGDGFGDLSQYDSDGNGWIDENDEIWDKLKVWYKDENGNDVLMNLLDADVGAIYLGSANTQFGLMGSGFNMDGYIRSTGVFLKESGGVGTVQHVDLAATKEDMTLTVGSASENGETTATQSDTVSATTGGVSQGAAAAQTITTNDGSGSVTESTVQEDADDKVEEVDALDKKHKEYLENLKEQEEARRRERKEHSAKQADKAAQHRKEEKERLEQLFVVRKEERERLNETRQTRMDRRREMARDLEMARLAG